MAAEEVAGFETKIATIETRLGVIQWMAATTVTLQIMTIAGFLGLLWKVFPVGG